MLELILRVGLCFIVWFIASRYFKWQTTKGQLFVNFLIWIIISLAFVGVN